MVFIAGSQNTICDISGKTLLFLVLSGLCTGGSWLCYFKALQLGDVNKVTPIDKSSTVLTLLLAFLILGEKLTVFRVFAIILIGTGTFLMIVRKDAQEKSDRGWAVFAVLSAVFASLTSILGKIGISGVESNLGTAIRTIVVLFMAWAVVFVSGKQNEIKTIDKKSMFFILTSGITTGLSWICFYKALKDGNASAVVPIDKLSVLVTIAFSYFVLKEKLTKKSLLGLVMITVGTLLMLV